MLNAKDFLSKNHSKISKESVRINIDHKIETLLSFMEVYNKSSELLNAEKLGLELEIVNNEIDFNKKGKIIKQLAKDVSISSDVIAKHVGNEESFSFSAYDFLFSIQNTRNEYLSSIRFIEEKDFEDDAPAQYELIGDIKIEEKSFWILSN